MSVREDLLNFGKLFAVLMALALAFALSRGQSIWPPVKLLSVAYLTILLPGYLLNKLLYKEAMKFTERATYSLAFGFVLLTTVVLYLNALGLRISAISAIAMLAGIYLALIFLLFRSK